MLRFFADASLRGVYVRALRRSFHGIDLITAHEAGLLDAPDDLILDYAADHDRITIAQDFATLPDFAYARIADGRAMPGVIEVPLEGPVAPILEDFRVILAASRPEDWRDRVVYLPL